MTSTLLMDANLAVLLIVGSANPDYIAKHKRLKEYDSVDYELLVAYIGGTSGLVFTPNVLTETSNLIRQIENPIKSELVRWLALWIERTTEQAVQSRVAVVRREYERLGLTDAGLIALAQSGGTILTVDKNLHIAAMTAGFRAVNFNHIRDQRPDFR